MNGTAYRLCLLDILPTRLHADSIRGAIHIKWSWLVHSKLSYRVKPFTTKTGEAPLYPCHTQT